MSTLLIPGVGLVDASGTLLIPGAGIVEQAAAAASFKSAWARNCNALIGKSMKKNVAGQKIGAQLVSATDGSAFTGAVTVYVTVDAGSQGAGSVGSGACTSEGNGYHTYAPDQAETNGDLLAFTFIGTGAVPATVQVHTSFPQTVDNATNISAIKTKTDFLPSVTAGNNGGVFIAGTNAATSITTALTANITGNLSGSVGSVTGAVGSVTGAVGSVTGAVGSVATGGITAASFAANAITAAKLDPDVTTELQTGLATATDLATVDTVVDAIKVKTDSLTFTAAGKVDANILNVNSQSIGATKPYDTAT